MAQHPLNDRLNHDPAQRPDAHPNHGDPDLVSMVPVSHLIRVVRRHLWLVLGVAAAVAAAAGGVAYAMGPVFRAVAVIRLSDARRALTGGVVDEPASADGRFSDPLLSQSALLTSRSVAGAVVDSVPALRLQAEDFPPSLLGAVAVGDAAQVQTLQLEFSRDSFVVRGSSQGRRAAYGTTVDLGEVRFAILNRPDGEKGTLQVLPREAAISLLIVSLRVKRRINTDIFDVSYPAPDPFLAQQVVNHVVTSFQAASAQAAQEQSRRRREFLEHQLAVNDSLLADARETLTEFYRRAGGYASREALLREQIGLAGLELERQQLQAERRTFQALLATLRDSSTSGRALQTALSTPDVAATPAVLQLSRQLFEYQLDRDSVSSRSPSHPDLPRLNQLISGTEEKLLTAVVAGVQSSIASLEGRLDAMEDLRARQRQVSATEGEEARLTERVENLRRMSDELRMEYQKAGIAEAVTVGQVEIVDWPFLPTEPVGLSLVEYIALGLVVGLGLGMVGALVAERLGRSIDQQAQVEQLGITVLAVVPHCGRAALETSKESPDAVVEALRGLRLGLVNAHGTDGPIMVALTSPGPGDGKSFISSNLALAFAYANYRTLLVDADLRRGLLHRTLGRPRQPGLTDCLVGHADPQQAVQRTTHASLDFIASGSRRRDAPELMGSPRMTDLLARMRSAYDIVVVDTPPLGAGVDAFTLARLAGNVLMVLRLGKTDRQVAEVKLELLRRLPVRLLGAILNDVRDGSEYRAYSYYIDGYELTREPLFRPLVGGKKSGTASPVG